MTRTLMLLIALTLLVGCANIEARRHASELRAMSQDDEFCIRQGLHYPDPVYVDCRYRLQNARAFRQWKSLELAQTAAIPKPVVGPASVRSSEIFHALNRDRFRCWPDPQFGHDYIFCGERDQD